MKIAARFLNEVTDECTTQIYDALARTQESGPI